MTNSQPAKILVVDDEAAIREYLQQVLGEWGYGVLTAPDGRAALPLAVQEQPDLILLDIMMPHLDGIETCRQLRERPTTRAIPVLILTSYDTPERLDESVAAGADDFLSKPINVAELRLRVRAMLRVKEMADRVARLEAYLRSVEQLRPAPPGAVP